MPERGNKAHILSSHEEEVGAPLSGAPPVLKSTAILLNILDVQVLDLTTKFLNQRMIQMSCFFFLINKINSLSPEAPKLGFPFTFECFPSKNYVVFLSKLTL